MDAAASDYESQTKAVIQAGVFHRYIDIRCPDDLDLHPAVLIVSQPKGPIHEENGVRLLPLQVSVRAQRHIIPLLHLFLVRPPWCYSVDL
eukprot:m.387049 g.387049  ORF g.387049 m.387049 type:complete len:90 (+) comp21026_c0_seq15:1597-1866(+)